MPRGLTALALALLLAGCASTPLQYTELEAPAADARVELNEVVFHPQEAYHCGPAALATVMEWAGEAIDPDTLAPRVYLEGRQGSLQAELIAATRRQGLLPYRQPPSFAALLRQLDAGQPVLILQNLALERWPVWHYAVVIGYDLERQEVILRSGTTERETLSFRRFERSWQKADYWALTVHRPDRLPADAEQTRYLEAAAGLEQVGQLEAAAQAYTVAVQTWPDSLPAWVGLGNIHYRQARYAQAAAHYQTALRYHPQSPAAHHNLAWALIRQGLYEDARPHAQRAYELSSAEQTHYHSAWEALQDAAEE
ncbi:hypothetical protein CAI21_10110 [Alkalilimnicola ehrlichii]|uniref:Peptidase C39-like domain-containing protein n=1 Tax=Alkalilimnicola ehrlichii TaxID=351052 RepID=A0A3E0WG57_9GAMM|nr:PA2778 family cysteine peptidase [Alkalilimnicola ehrlichii]RFA29404.1 hypothetical protein CAI21_10110 [Alkalilimnicola ehrlichii]RFA31922.1 hypothetical protein CAL65_20955 [Alkalilimnicola ehrlichii]